MAGDSPSTDNSLRSVAAEFVKLLKDSQESAALALLVTSKLTAEQLVRLREEFSDLPQSIKEPAEKVLSVRAKELSLPPVPVGEIPSVPEKSQAANVIRATEIAPQVGERLAGLAVPPRAALPATVDDALLSEKPIVSVIAVAKEESAPSSKVVMERQSITVTERLEPEPLPTSRSWWERTLFLIPDVLQAAVKRIPEIQLGSAPAPEEVAPQERQTAKKEIIEQVATRSGGFIFPGWQQNRVLESFVAPFALDDLVVRSAERQSAAAETMAEKKEVSEIEAYISRISGNPSIDLLAVAQVNGELSRLAGKVSGNSRLAAEVHTAKIKLSEIAEQARKSRKDGLDT